MSDYDNYDENLAFDPSKATTRKILEHSYRFDDCVRQVPDAIIMENQSLSAEIRRIQSLVHKLNQEVIELQLLNNRKDKDVRVLLALLETQCPQFEKWIDKNFKEYRDDPDKMHIIKTDKGILAKSLLQGQGGQMVDCKNCKYSDEYCASGDCPNIRS